MIFRSRSDREPAARGPAPAAERAQQLAVGVDLAATAAGRRDAKVAEAARDAGRRLADATAALADALAKGAAEDARHDARLQKEAEALLARGVELLHRLHFELIRFDLQETEPDVLPIEEVERAAGEIGGMAERLGGQGAP